jgi:hypothetical protein
MLELYTLIPDAMEKFSFGNYYNDEEKVIKPALEKLGYSNIRFSMGEYDSFGPLSRVITAIKNGQTVTLVYG